MCDQTEVPYLPDDVVWVKLSNVWWPAQVQDEAKLSEDVTSGLRKKPLAIVKFFDEDSYEFPKNINQIYHYNCFKKDEFIKKGLDALRPNGYREISESMKKFPIDIKKAEILTGGNPNIIDDPKYLPEEKFDYREEFGLKPRRKSSSNFKRTRIDSDEIIETPKKPRVQFSTPLSAPSTSRTPIVITPKVITPKAPKCIMNTNQKFPGLNVMVQLLGNSSPTKSKPVMACSYCAYTCDRTDVMIEHYKHHYIGLIYPPPSHIPHNYFKLFQDNYRLYKSRVMNMAARKEREYVRRKISEGNYAPHGSKRKHDGGSRKEKKSSLGSSSLAVPVNDIVGGVAVPTPTTSSSSPAPKKKRIRKSKEFKVKEPIVKEPEALDILKDWEDDFEEEVEINLNNSDSSLEDRQNDSSHIEKSIPSGKDEAINNKPLLQESKSEVKEKSCFDFEDTDESLNVSKTLKFGQKLPRVISEEKPNVQKLLKELQESKEIEETIMEQDKTSKEEEVITNNEKDLERQEFEILLKDTAVPKLPNIPLLNIAVPVKDNSSEKLEECREDEKNELKECEKEDSSPKIILQTLENDSEELFPGVESSNKIVENFEYSSKIKILEESKSVVLVDDNNSVPLSPKCDTTDLDLGNTSLSNEAIRSVDDSKEFSSPKKSSIYGENVGQSDSKLLSSSVQEKISINENTNQPTAIITQTDDNSIETPIKTVDKLNQETNDIFKTYENEGKVNFKLENSIKETTGLSDSFENLMENDSVEEVLINKEYKNVVVEDHTNNLLEEVVIKSGNISAREVRENESPKDEESTSITPEVSPKEKTLEEKVVEIPNGVPLVEASKDRTEENKVVEVTTCVAMEVSIRDELAYDQIKKEPTSFTQGEENVEEEIVEDEINVEPKGEHSNVSPSNEMSKGNVIEEPTDAEDDYTVEIELKNNQQANDINTSNQESRPVKECDAINNKPIIISDVQTGLQNISKSDQDLSVDQIPFDINSMPIVIEQEEGGNGGKPLMDIVEGPIDPSPDMDVIKLFIKDVAGDQADGSKPKRIISGSPPSKIKLSSGLNNTPLKKNATPQVQQQKSQIVFIKSTPEGKFVIPQQPPGPSGRSQISKTVTNSQLVTKSLQPKKGTATKVILGFSDNKMIPKAQVLHRVTPSTVINSKNSVLISSAPKVIAGRPVRNVLLTSQLKTQPGIQVSPSGSKIVMTSQMVKTNQGTILPHKSCPSTSGLCETKKTAIPIKIKQPGPNILQKTPRKLPRHQQIVKKAPVLTIPSSDQQQPSTEVMAIKNLPIVQNIPHSSTEPIKMLYLVEDSQFAVENCGEGNRNVFISSTNNSENMNNLIFSLDGNVVSFSNESTNNSTVNSGQDILAKALANTQVLQSETADSVCDNSIYVGQHFQPPTLSNNVLETSLTLNQPPIMSPLEVPSSITPQPSNISQMTPVSNKSDIQQPSMPLLTDDVEIPSQTIFLNDSTSTFQIVNDDNLVVSSGLVRGKSGKQTKQNVVGKEDNVLPEFLKGNFGTKSDSSKKDSSTKRSER